MEGIWHELQRISGFVIQEIKSEVKEG